jgi:hypothetical protein
MAPSPIGPPRPPLSERDGSEARAQAADAADWRPVKCQSDAGHGRGHTYWFPPEIAYLAREGAIWSEHEAILRPALIAREQAAREQAAREQAAREQAREQEAREQEAREQAALPKRRARRDGAGNRARMQALHDAAGNRPWQPKDAVAAAQSDPVLRGLDDASLRRIWRKLQSDI